MRLHDHFDPLQSLAPHRVALRLQLTHQNQCLYQTRPNQLAMMQAKKLVQRVANIQRVMAQTRRNADEYCVHPRLQFSHPSYAIHARPPHRVIHAMQSHKVQRQLHTLHYMLALHRVRVAKIKCDRN